MGNRTIVFTIILGILFITAGIIHFLIRHKKKTKTQPQKQIVNHEITRPESKIHLTPQDLWLQAKDALAIQDIKTAAKSAFAARKEEARLKGYAFEETSVFSNPLLVQGFVYEIKDIDIPIQGIVEEVKTQLRIELMLATLKGENPKDTERKTREFLADFMWPEFDTWCERFKEAKEWPFLWGNIANYFYIQDYQVDELLPELTKEQLLQLAAAYSVNVKKSQNKPVIMNSLLNIIPEKDIDKILSMVNQEWHPRYLREKRFLLIHTLEFKSTSQRRLKQIKEAGHTEFIQIDTTPGGCIFCEKMQFGKIKVADIQNENMPPFHPGCRCMILPSD